MKTKNLLMSAMMLSTLVGGTATSFAAEYEDATHAKTDASITFIEDDEPTNPVDPTDPTKPVIPTIPVNPINPNGAELMITYASDLNFGEQAKSGTSWNALADKVKDTEEGEEREIMPFVSTKDSRGSERKGWTLTAQQDGDFKNGKDVLKGAELHFSNLFYAANEGAPTATAEEIVLGLDAQEISMATADTGVGQWSVGLGELQGEEGSQTTNGVTLTVPTTTAKNTDTYTTTVTWELVVDPAAAE